LINDFNPTAFTTLAYQLEVQAQNVAATSTSAQNTQAAVADASSMSTAATPPTLQSFSSSSQSGSNGQAAQGFAPQPQRHGTGQNLQPPKPERFFLKSHRRATIRHPRSLLDLAASIS